jgi:hypothetical protein
VRIAFYKGGIIPVYVGWASRRLMWCYGGIGLKTDRSVILYEQP